MKVINSKISVKIKTSFVMVFSLIVLFIVGTMIFFQYKSSNEFALLTTQKVFDGISNKVINKINTYDLASSGFIRLTKNIKDVDELPEISKAHILLPVITEYISNANYVYGIYLGYSNNDFYIIYNLDLSPKMRTAQKAPAKARWLVKKNVQVDGKFISYKNFIDKDFNTISIVKSPTDYQPTKRPWYKDAIKSDKMVKTKPYVFSALQEPGITYAQAIDSKKSVVLSLDITLSSLSELLKKQKLVEGSASFIFKDDGKLIGQYDNISHKHIENLNKQYPNIFMKNKEVLDIEEQKIVIINGKEYLKYTTLLKSGFDEKDYLTIVSPIDTIMKPYKEKIYQTLAVTLLVLFILILPIVFYTVKLIVRPIILLQKENKKIAEGKFKDINYVDSFMDEISSLSNSLVTMAGAIEESQRTLESKVEERTTDLEMAKQEVESIHKHTRESIEYAALIQGALLPTESNMKNYFKDYFVHWRPKDTVGGDIWLFNKLRHKDECLLMFIDCTGHGVPGAFVTMIVKAIEREIVAKIRKDKLMDVSPSWIMAYFNKTMKSLLKQETKDSKSNAGWDGGIIYYNKKTQILKFAGAETPLFYIDENQEFQTVKGNRYSVGYKKCKSDYEYKETIIEVKEGMKFYCTTDGYLDQNGGEKDFPFGKRKFGNIIKENHNVSMIEQRDIFIEQMNKYELMIEDNDRNDDMTVIGFEITEQSIDNDIILEYEGVLTQGIIAHSMDILEHSIENMGMMGKLSTLVIELTQNMMNYSKSHDLNCTDIRPAGLIDVSKDKDGIYYVESKNIISLDDKNRIEPKLLEIEGLDESAIKKRYRELRRSGENTHDKGGGIGFYEIAKLTNSFKYNFEIINDEKYYFEFKATVEPRRK